jgi:hypothetical protein
MAREDEIREKYEEIINTQNKNLKEEVDSDIKEDEQS